MDRGSRRRETDESVADRMRVDLIRAIKANDGPALAALRTALAALANAGARRPLSRGDIDEILRREIDDRMATAEELTAEIAVLERYVSV